MGAEKTNINTTEVPLYTNPQQTVVIVSNNETDDFTSACLGTGCCGLIGLCFVGCMCNTPTGRVGASTGCIFYGAIAFITYLTLLIIYKKDDCDDSSASGGFCDSFFGHSMINLIANLALGVVIVIVAIILRIKYIKELQQNAAIHVAI
eukprot:TRINITY_DN8301_c0_g1_i1.p1 TRINITY_DN8301_c0_g1~~TRINITY_DN8301_c0_g1_i1.p1  ORF type:complete len:149 (+),score=15.66 TRINITY_DN8301_c0_g1_i1:66-512(+)